MAKPRRQRKYKPWDIRLLQKMIDRNRAIIDSGKPRKGYGVSASVTAKEATDTAFSDIDRNVPVFTEQAKRLGEKPGPDWIAEWVAKQDDRTCPYCASMHKQRMRVGSVEFRTYSPPAHINCRCKWVHFPPGTKGHAEGPHFVPPPPDVIEKHGHFVTNPEEYQELRIPAGPNGRDFVWRNTPAGKKLQFVPPDAALAKAATARGQAVQRPLRLDPLDGQKAHVDYEEWNKALDVNGARETRDVTKARIEADLEARMTRAMPDEWAAFKANTGEDAASLVDAWAGSSADEDRWSIAMQLATEKEFGLARASVKHFDLDTVRSAQGLLDEHGAVMQRMLRAQYEATQEWLVAQGKDHITLFRGVGLEGATERMAMQPLSSFSTSPRAAISFAKNRVLEDSASETMEAVVYGASVPRQRVLSTSQTGYGCKHEAEMVVLGGEEVAWKASVPRAELLNATPEKRTSLLLQALNIAVTGG